jgi:hypothetical protein
MNSVEILDIVKDVFSDYVIEESTWTKYDVTYSRFLIKTWSEKLKSNFKIAEVKNRLVGTVVFENVWVIIFNNYISQDFEFDIRNKTHLEMIRDWNDEYSKVYQKNNELLSQYNRIKKDYKSELRDYQLKKLL